MEHLLTSYLFVLPIFLGLVLEVHDVAAGSAICLATSVMLHSNPGNSILRWIDIVTVNTIGVYFNADALLRWYMNKKDVKWLLGVALALSALLIYFRGDAHGWVHIIAVSGICVYIVCRRLAHK